MSNSPPFLIIHKPCVDSVTWAVHRLEQGGLQVIRTFDLLAARLAHSDCLCPHHGTAQCNCQMVVLLVYQGDNPPVTMAIHGTDETGWFFITNIPQQPVNPQQEKYIKDILSRGVCENA